MIDVDGYVSMMMMMMLMVVRKASAVTQLTVQRATDVLGLCDKVTWLGGDNACRSFDVIP